jgi:hypothetical protein
MSIIDVPQSTAEELDAVTDAAVSGQANAVDLDEGTFCEVSGSLFGPTTTAIYLRAFDIPPIDPDRRGIQTVTISVVSEFLDDAGLGTQEALATVAIQGVSTLRTSFSPWAKTTDNFNVNPANFFDIVNWEIRCSLTGTAAGTYDLEKLRIYSIYITYTYDDPDPLEIDNLDERISQAVTEVLEGGKDTVRVSQAVTEVLEAGKDTVRISQAVTEVLVKLRAPTGFRVFIAG